MSEILPVQVDETEAALQAAAKAKKTSNVSVSEEPSRQQGTIRNGIIYGPDGKPCRTCNSLKDLMALTKRGPPSPPPTPPASTSSTTTSTAPTEMDCPPDVETLGRSTWTLLHSLAATYPTMATPAQQTEMSTFLRIFSRIYPCWFCAADFRKYMERSEPKLSGRQEFGNWMCEAHNAVNVKLGKKEFDCRFWEERWKEASNGRCG